MTAGPGYFYPLIVSQLGEKLGAWSDPGLVTGSNRPISLLMNFDQLPKIHQAVYAQMILLLGGMLSREKDDLPMLVSNYSSADLPSLQWLVLGDISFSKLLVLPPSPSAVLHCCGFFRIGGSPTGEL